MVERKEYLDALWRWKDSRIIKVVTGVRRCGKSTLLQQFQQRLLREGVAKEQLISINFEALEQEALTDYRELYRSISEQLLPDRMNYIFLDEIQLVDSFQRAVDSLFLKENVDLYLTGSNAWLLSGELATLLSGRYIELSLLPLSFGEYCALRGEGDRTSQFADYLRYGALPYLASLDKLEEKADIYLEGIYNTILIKDIELRQARREADPNRRKVTDLTLLRNISRFLASSVGNPVTVKKIADTLTSSGRKISPNTVGDYLDALVEPFLFYPVERFDVLGKQLLKQNQKFYIVDLGLRRHLLPRQNYDLGFSFENVVYLELLRRGYAVNIGKVGQTEVDFVARKGEELHYYQVTASLLDQRTFEREMAPLRAIPDNYPKTILTLDGLTPGNYEGVEVAGGIDWLFTPGGAHFH